VPVPTTQPPPATAKTGTVYSTSIQPRRCVDVRSANTANGTPVQGYDCNGTGAQSVTFTTAGTMQILGKCVQPQSGSVGALVVINDCVGGSAIQQWRVSGGAVRHLASGLCLGLPNADPANWIQLRLETCNGTTGQRWTTPL
jgi:beta-glucosidase